MQLENKLRKNRDKELRNWRKYFANCERAELERAAISFVKITLETESAIIGRPMLVKK